MTADLDHERQVRPLLVDAVQKRLAGENVLFLKEFCPPTADWRIDLATLSADALVGYEVKADKDSLGRLPSQIAHYSPVLDRAYLVTTPKHQQRAEDVLPSWWGVLVFTSVDDLQVIRASTDNPNVSLIPTLKLLRGYEAAQLFRRLELKWRGVSRTRAAMAAIMLDDLGPTKARREGLGTLWKRDHLRERSQTVQQPSLFQSRTTSGGARTPGMPSGVVHAGWRPGQLTLGSFANYLMVG